MEAIENKEVVYEFGDFVVDPNEKVLLVNGQAIHLPAKEFETLLLLVRHNGHALTKEEMISAIWQDAFVEEGNLAKQISRLRKIFNSRGQELIKTIPKHGYRFNVPDLRRRESQALEPVIPVIIEKRIVKRVEIDLPDRSSEQLSHSPLPPKPRSLLRKRSFFLAAGVLFIAAASVASYFWFFKTQGPTDASDVRSIAVLPFKPVGSSDSDEDLRLGLTDGLITKLGNLNGLIVRPTNAVRKYDTADSMAAGRDLGVDAVLDGNVQRIDGRVRVNVQLVSVRNGGIIWGGTFDEPFTDVFRVQDAIVEGVAPAIELRLTGADKQLIAKRYTTNPEAHYAYIKGRILWNKRTSANFVEAIKYFNEAIEKDPNYALAYAGLADSYSLLADYRGAIANESYEKAEKAALKALALDENLAEAHTSIAYVRMYHSWDWQGAENGYKRAIELNPNYATAHQWYSEYLAGMGRFDEALAEIRRAKEIDPLAPVIHAVEVWILYHARRYDEAIENGRRLAEMEPQFAEVQEYLKRCYDQKGMYKEAIAARQMRRKLAGLDPAETPPIKRAAAAVDSPTYWQNRLEQEIVEMRTEPPSPFDMAEIYAQLRENNKAFEWLEKSLEERAYTIMYLKVAPNLDPLRSDPRFEDLLRRSNLAS